MKDFIEKFSVTELAVIIFCGAALLMSIAFNQKEVCMAIGGGLVGYLGGVTTSKNDKEE